MNALSELCYPFYCARSAFPLSSGNRSGRSAAWLARLVRDQEVDGSNPFAPTILFNELDSVLTLSLRLV